jgi:competence protein ComEA
VAERVRLLLGDAGDTGDAGDAGDTGRATGAGDAGRGAAGGADGTVRAAGSTGAWLPGEWLDAARPAPRAPAVGARLRPPEPGPGGGGLLGRLRWQPDRRAVAAVALAVLAAALLTAWWVLSARPRDLAVHTSSAGVGPVSTGPGRPAPSAGSSPGRAVPTSRPSGSATAARLVVDVAGKVRRPGVYELAPGARVIDALRAAGGARRGASTTSLNLAAPLHDGEQVVVGLPGAPVAGAAGAVAGTAPAGPIDLNTATFEQLQTLPGVGPVLAQRILDWRADHGRFDSVDQLNDVSGIGTVKFAQLRDRVTV